MIDASAHASLLSAAIRNTGAALFLHDADQSIVWAEEAGLPSPSLGAVLPAGGTYGDLLGRVCKSGDPERIEMFLDLDGARRVHDLWVEVVTVNGRSMTLSTVIDVTEHWRREQTLRTLLRELSHRSKNLLAIILSVATQTGRYAPTIQNFLERFRGRVQSLAASQDLVTSSNWRGAQLKELVAAQMQRYCDDPDRRFRFVGDDPHLDPNAAMHVGLALHELTVNSVSFGALSRGTGHVIVEASYRDDGSCDLVWTEDTGEIVVLPQQGRFGSVALERVVPAAVDGTASFTARDTVLTYKLNIPGSNIDRS